MGRLARADRQAGDALTLKALLFDMDGTLVDSDPIHIAVFIDLMAEHGISLTEAEYFDRIHGRTNIEIFSDLLPNEDPREMDLSKEAAYRARIGGGALQPVKGAGDLINRAAAAGLGLGVVTNGPRANLEAGLSATGLSAAFTAMVSSDDVARGKPDPEPYQSALDILGIGPKEALVFEDSPAGIASATSAGIIAIGLSTSLAPQTLVESGAEFAIGDYTDPNLNRFLKDTLGAAA